MVCLIVVAIYTSRTAQKPAEPETEFSNLRLLQEFGKLVLLPKGHLQSRLADLPKPEPEWPRGWSVAAISTHLQQVLEVDEHGATLMAAYLFYNLGDLGYDYEQSDETLAKMVESRIRWRSQGEQYIAVVTQLHDYSTPGLRLYGTVLLGGIGSDRAAQALEKRLSREQDPYRSDFIRTSLAQCGVNTKIRVLELTSEVLQNADCSEHGRATTRFYEALESLCLIEDPLVDDSFRAIRKARTKDKTLLDAYIQIREMTIAARLK